MKKFISRLCSTTKTTIKNNNNNSNSNSNNKKKQSWSVISTTTDSVYTISEMEKDIDFVSWTSHASKLFQSESCYLSPKELNYQLPSNGVPEYAFIGRSNVGKSSLIGNLLGNKKLVVTSKEPGCTKSINYYLLHSKTGKKQAYIVDLPGYGFAKISKEERNNWDKMIKDYLLARDISVLRRVYLLIDSRRGPNKDDCEMIELLSRASITHQIILTKADLLPQIELNKILQSTFDEIMKPKRHGCFPVVHLISSRTNFGILPLMQSIAEVNSIDFGKEQVLDQNSMTPEQYEENIKYMEEMKKRQAENESHPEFDMSSEQLGSSPFLVDDKKSKSKPKSNSNPKSKSNSKSKDSTKSSFKSKLNQHNKKSSHSNHSRKSSGSS